MNLLYFIDESGSEDWDNQSFFTVSSTVIDQSNLLRLEGRFIDFKSFYSKKLGQEIQFLHGNEITNGLNNGKGTYAKLNKDKTLADDFFHDLQDILSDKHYRIVSLTLDLRRFIEIFNNKIDQYYKSRNENYQVSQMFNNVIYPLCLLTLTEQIRIHINSQMKRVENVKFFIEEKESDVTSIIKRCHNRFSDVNIAIEHGIKKGSVEYSPLLELADLSANAINANYQSSTKRKDYEAIKNNISILKLINDKNFEEYMPFNL